MENETGASAHFLVSFYIIHSLHISPFLVQIYILEDVVP